MFYVFVFLLVTSFIFNLPTVKGWVGEKWVRYFLKRLNQEEYIVLNDILLPSREGRTTQIDHLIISVYGIFVIETKNYKGWIYGSENSRNWTQVIYRNKEKFANPIFQNYGHIKAVESLIKDQFQTPMYSIIAFHPRATLKKIDIKSEHIKVIYLHRILRTISAMKDKVLSKNDIKSIEEILLKSIITDKRANKQHVKIVKEVQKDKRKKISSGVCPKCGGNLTERKGKYGTFHGCSNYPNCRFTA
ncbi:NERD domain-containing protein [Cytobacillus oceanisediminis]|uniref:NERD domain-containing protein n=1 Tax=Cytobacillus oceanisediminis TaxID=665099 RepID=UPI001D158A3F|nr:NERD domain-containing protein [Cytobacillus oceanisediminis]MCC3648554.1 NERD domain-containing protein [Cytobacillus oceanisediminis]